MGQEDHPTRQASGRTRLTTCMCGRDKIRFVVPLLLCPHCDKQVIEQHKRAVP